MRLVPTFGLQWLSAVARRSAEVLGVVALAGSVSAAEPSADYVQWLAELEGMLASRETDDYELMFQPVDFDRLVVTDADGEQRVFHYLSFLLRNTTISAEDYLDFRASSFRDVMEGFIDRDDVGDLDFATEQGAVLRVETEALERDGTSDLGVIAQRQNSVLRTRTLNLSALVLDENGTRLEHFRFALDDQSEKPTDFTFADEGKRRVSTPNEAVRDALIERYNRAVYTADDLRGRELPPYDPSIVDEYGNAQGEVFGAFIFDRLPQDGDFFDVQVSGVSNKMRTRFPDAPSGMVEDYFNVTVLNRIFQLRVDRPGDEYYLADQPIRIRDQGWRWTAAFQRLNVRKTIAYSRYYLNNAETASSGAADQALVNQAVVTEFWEHYRSQRNALSDRYQVRIDRHELAIERVTERLEGLIDEAELPEDKQAIAKRLNDEVSFRRTRIAALRDRIAGMDDRMPDLQVIAEGE